VIFNQHDCLPDKAFGQPLDEVDIPDIDLLNYHKVTLANYLKDAEILDSMAGVKEMYHQ
jgi:hypothetical protein